ncbi:hypothetical protein Pyn_14228 [Prunus yedoensis var. nudiflora]|uniref:Uncharacterized protein n=1 Tax=Prunus yedoensis var. nudiflora TaxID=2094558 RepID=A0A314XRN6_PRUYE|nr:hypothetical protein Pyn_14228 [Prunus yedoensis var. nudiflora]
MGANGITSPRAIASAKGSPSRKTKAPKHPEGKASPRGYSVILTAAPYFDWLQVQMNGGDDVWHC